MLAGLFILLLVLILLGAPVIVALDLVALGGFLLNEEVSPVEFPKRMFTFLDSFGLLALPYFVLAGELLSRSGMSKKLVQLANALVGRWRGGLGQVSVLGCMAFGNVCGSAAAATAAIGGVLSPSMKEAGYKPGFTAAVIGCSGIIGSIIPPSMIMIVYGSMAQVSIGGLFLAGVLPGLLITALMMGAVAIFANAGRVPSANVGDPSTSLTEAKCWPNASPATPAVGSLRAFLGAWDAVVAPVIILGGIFTGFFTATEAGVVACVYALVISLFVRRTLKLRELWGVLLNAAITTAIVVGVISAAGGLAYLITFLRLDEWLRGALLSVSDNGYVVVALLLVVMIVLAMFIESLAVLVVLVPVIAQIGQAFGFDPLHFGMLIVVATQIGAVTPPVAVVLFVATTVADARYDQTLRHCLPFIVALLLGLVLLFFVPALATFLPGLVAGGAG